VTDVRLDTQKDMFEATLVAPSTDRPLSRLIVSGHIQRMVSVPVLKNTMREGDIVGAADIDMMDIPQADLQSGTILKADDLEGMTPRRMALAGKPLRDLDMQQPQIVARGDNVTIVYKDGPMILTASGKAMQNGAKGDQVRVVNTSSNRPVDGFVDRQGEIVVSGHNVAQD
jgi:flagella basal body P-ring formation protein FlgA